LSDLERKSIEPIAVAFEGVNNVGASLFRVGSRETSMYQYWIGAC